MVSYSEIQKQLAQNALPQGTYGLQLGDYNPQTSQTVWGGAQWAFYTDKETALAIAHAWREEGIERAEKRISEEPNHPLANMWKEPQAPENIAPHYKIVNFSQSPPREESVQSQLAQKYPELSDEVLHTIGRCLQLPETNGASINHTSSDVVLPITLNGKRTFAKVHSNKILEPEAHALRLANQYPETRAITPCLIDYLQDECKGILLTYDTQQHGIIAAEDIKAYLRLKRNVFSAYANQQKASREQIANPIYTDVFNATLLQAFLKPHVRYQLFTQASERLVLPFEELEERLSRTADLQRLQQHRRLYEENRARLAQLPLSPATVIIDDAKSQNVFPGKLRPRGDFGEVKTGSPEYALARMERYCNADYAAFAACARNEIEDYIQKTYAHDPGFSGYTFRYTPKDTTRMQEAVKALSPIAATRLLSFALKQGLPEDAARYEQAINRYQSQMQQEN